MQHHKSTGSYQLTDNATIIHLPTKPNHGTTSVHSRTACNSPLKTSVHPSQNSIKRIITSLKAFLSQSTVAV